MSTAIQTFKGELFDYADLMNNQINIDDIAHSLSLNCRYNGHCRQFYSVATHSCLVYRLMENTFYHGNPLNLTLKDLFYGLIHDVGEAYFVDLPRPLKNYFISDPKFKDFQRIYNEMEGTLVERVFGEPVSEETEKKMKIFDIWALKIESKYLMSENISYWGTAEEDRLGLVEPGFAKGMILSDKSHQYWEELFKQDFSEIKGKILESCNS